MVKKKIILFLLNGYYRLISAKKFDSTELYRSVPQVKQ